MPKSRSKLTPIREILPAIVKPETAEVLFDGDIKREDIGYAHPVFLQCFLPTRHFANNLERWQTDCGRASLVIRAGELANPDKPHEFEKCVVPAGPKARFVVAYVNDYIQRHNNPTVDMGRSLRDAMTKLGIPVGGKNGDALTQEVKNFAAAEISLAVWDDQGVEHRGGRVAPRLRFWLEKNANQSTIWRPEMTVSQEYFHAIRENDRLAPFYWPAMVALSNDVRAMDIHSFLVYRLRNELARPIPLHRSVLHQLFGRDIKSPRKFWQSFQESLAAALEWYPDARVELHGDFLVLKSSPPLIAHRKLHHLGHI